jgi:transcriptional regulator GlxA family with amidase domain
MKFGGFIYDGVEPIDLATFGVLSMARRIRPDIEICTLAPMKGEVRLSNGLVVLADHALAEAPKLDVLIVTGGPGWQTESQRAETLEALRRLAGNTLLVSVCTGGMILGASGVLDGKLATTKREVVPPERSPLAVMRERHPRIDVREASLVDAGTVVTGGGVSLCIDAILHLLERFYGKDVARETAPILEYQRAWSANLEKFPPLPSVEAATSIGRVAMFKRIDHVEIVTDQPELTVAFYTDVLGFTVRSRDRIERSGLGVPMNLVYLDLGGTTVELIAYEGGAVAPAPAQEHLGYRLIALEVDDMDKTLAYLKTKGVEAVWGPRVRDNYARAEICDPNGNHIELRQWF